MVFIKKSWISPRDQLCKQETEFLKNVSEHNYRLLFAFSLVFQVSESKGERQQGRTRSSQSDGEAGRE